MSYRDKPPAPDALPPGLTKNQAAWLEDMNVKISWMEHAAPGEKEPTARTLLEIIENMNKETSLFTTNIPKTTLIAASFAAALPIGALFLAGEALLRGAGMAEMADIVSSAARFMAPIGSVVAGTVMQAAIEKKMVKRNAPFFQALKDSTARIHTLVPSTALPAPRPRVEETRTGQSPTPKKTRVEAFTRMAAPGQPLPGTEEEPTVGKETTAHRRGNGLG